ncbi:hypothetical protein DXT71_29300, partial [Escherichia coli]
WEGWAILLRQKQKKLIMLPSETMIWQPEFTDKTLSRKPGAVHIRDDSIATAPGFFMLSPTWGSVHISSKSAMNLIKNTYYQCVVYCFRPFQNRVVQV